MVQHERWCVLVQLAGHATDFHLLLNAATVVLQDRPRWTALLMMIAHEPVLPS
jgi:hypothetical protein